MTIDDRHPLLISIAPSSHDIGAFTVNRTLPSRGRTMVGPFIFVDAFGPAQFDPGGGMDVRPHPHINLSTVTYLFDGAIGHRDSIGTRTVIEAGAVNLMTAGSGIVHSERSPLAERQRAAGSHHGRIYGMQTWLALPDGREEIDPAFEHVAAADLPLIGDAGVQARVIMGRLWGEAAPTTQHAPTVYADIRLSPGGRIPIDAEAEERALIVVGGSATLDSITLAPQLLHILRPGHAATLASEQGGIVMLLGGAAFATTRHVWWNFVSSSRERIVQARDDWNAHRFATVPGDEIERIEIPAVPNTVSYP